MKKMLLFSFLLFSVHTFGQNLVLLHDTTVAGSNQVKRLADKDTLQAALAQLLGGYTVMTFDASTTLSGLDAYSAIILQETSFDDLALRYLSQPSKDAIKNWLNSGTSGSKKALVSIGADQGYNYSRSGSPAIDTNFTNSYLGFFYRLDNGNVTGQNAITGVGIDAGMDRGMTTSPVGSGFYPDAVQPLGSTVLYQYKGRGASDSVAAVGVNKTGFVTASIFQDPRYFTGGFTDVLFNTIAWVIANGGQFQGFVPVELTAFAAASKGNSVTLNWSTATEVNNSGFEVERRTASTDFSKVGFVGGFGTTTEAKVYSFEDNNLASGKYTYRLKQIDYDGTFEYSGEVEVDVVAPAEFALHQNFPNPFNPATQIKYSIAAGAFVSISVYNALGEKVADLVNQIMEPGEYTADFDASNLSSGLYFYKIEAGKYNAVKKMMLLK